MKQTLLPIAVVFAAILSLALYPNLKGDKSMNDSTAANPSILIETTMGKITIELDTENAPNTCANFLAYVDDGYFVDTTFHRVIPNFMIQGGGITADMQDKPSKRAPIENDRRATRVRLSRRGRQAFARMAIAHEGWINQIMRGFSNAETQQLIGLLGKLKLTMAEARR